MSRVQRRHVQLERSERKYGGATERVLRLLSAEWGMKCTFAGCDFVSTQRDIIAHSNTCKYKPFACAILFCASTEVNIVPRTGSLRPKYHPRCRHYLVPRKNMLEHTKTLLRVLEDVDDHSGVQIMQYSRGCLGETIFVHEIDLMWVAPRGTFPLEMTNTPEIDVGYRTWTYMIGVSENFETNAYVIINAYVDNEKFVVSVTDMMHRDDNYYVAKFEVVPNKNFGAPPIGKIVKSVSYERNTICDYLAPHPMPHFVRNEFEEAHIMQICNYERYSKDPHHVSACQRHFTRYINYLLGADDEEELFVTLRVQIVPHATYIKLNNYFPEFSSFNVAVRSAGLLQNTSHDFKWDADFEDAAPAPAVN